MQKMNVVTVWCKRMSCMYPDQWCFECPNKEECDEYETKKI